MRAERDEIQRIRCEDSVHAWWSSSEITLHGESVQQFKQNCSRCNHGPAGRLVIVKSGREVGPATGRWLQLRRDRQREKFVELPDIFQVHDALSQFFALI